MEEPPKDLSVTLYKFLEEEPLKFWTKMFKEGPEPEQGWAHNRGSISLVKQAIKWKLASLGYSIYLTA